MGLFDRGKPKRNKSSASKRKGNRSYAVMESTKGGSKRLVHIFGFGKSAPKGVATKCASSMRKAMRETDPGKYTYRVVVSYRAE